MALNLPMGPEWPRMAQEVFDISCMLLFGDYLIPVLSAAAFTYELNQQPPSDDIGTAVGCGNDVSV